MTVCDCSPQDYFNRLHWKGKKCMVLVNLRQFGLGQFGTKCFQSEWKFYMYLLTVNFSKWQCVIVNSNGVSRDAAGKNWTWWIKIQFVSWSWNCIQMVMKPTWGSIGYIMLVLYCVALFHAKTFFGSQFLFWLDIYVHQLLP